MRKLITTICITIAVLLGSAGFSWGANYRKGLDAYSKSDYTTALREIKPLAEQGNADAQSLLGIMYEFGQGVPENIKTALKWYRLAADQGVARAQKRYGELVLQDFVYGSDIRKLENLGKSVETLCKRNIKCAFDKVWAYLDITKDGYLSL